MRKKSITPIGDQAGKDDTFFKGRNTGLGYGALIGYEAPLYRVDRSTGFITMPTIKGGKMKTTNKKRIKELEDKVKRLENDAIPAHRIIVGHRSPHVTTGQEFTVQEFAKLLLDELGLTLVRTRASVKLEKTAGKGGPGSKAIK